ncbi:hypothetical protein [Allonocardiopsis opalescens]|uniref:Uncharacterized protein n=1 Tax=Allonocardiopsis opalescens TaxID=1144618 RepID=A0A2T0QC76_9ACTN|nr:hypothetical protein [Allonocardiopsis opalescens]PRY01453.1 hypothetical protein CLV72_10135 [Allonocardiopsis opalescens]
MPPALRHLLGFLVGVVITPVLWVLLAAGYGLSYQAFTRLAYDGTLVGAIVLLLVFGAMTALVAGSRLSPVAALVSGTAFMALIGYQFVARDYFFPASLIDFDRLPVPLAVIETGAGSIIMFAPAVGGILLVSALFPSRWRSSAAPALPRGYAGYTDRDGTPPPYPGTAPAAAPYGEAEGEPGGYRRAERGGPGTGPQPAFDPGDAEHWSASRAMPRPVGADGEADAESGSTLKFRRDDERP